MVASSPSPHDAIDEILPGLIADRHLREDPELGMQKYETATFVACLERLGVKVMVAATLCCFATTQDQPRPLLTNTFRATSAAHVGQAPPQPEWSPLTETGRSDEGESARDLWRRVAMQCL